ncbi:MAG: hypothetical protein AAF368_13215, partial [Planctomycetota bacterium]
MKEEGLMSQIAQVVDDQKVVSQLEKLAAGQLSTKERQALEEAASTDAALRRAVALCAPMNETFNARLAMSMQRSLRPDAPSASTESPDRAEQTESGDTSSSTGPSSSAEEPGLVERCRQADRFGRASRGWRRAFRLAAPWGAAVVAASVLVFFFVGSSPTYLPPFSLKVSLAQDIYRAAPVSTTVLSVSRGVSMELLLRPALRVSAPVKAWVFLERDSNALSSNRRRRFVSPVAARSEMDPSGAIKMVVPVGDWPSGPGRGVVAGGPPTPRP